MTDSKDKSMKNYLSSESKTFTDKIDSDFKSTLRSWRIFNLK